jgi:uncharacterized heparinase superfamily protein
MSGPAPTNHQPDLANTARKPQNPPSGWHLAVAKRPIVRNLKALIYGVKSLFYGTSLHTFTLRGRVASKFCFIPIDPWPGNADRGRDITGGTFSFAGHSHQCEHPDLSGLWKTETYGPAWRSELHKFGWLRDLRVAGGEATRIEARRLISDWISAQGTWHRFSWRPDILSARVSAWISSADFLCQGASPEFMDTFLKSLSHQSRHLLRLGNGAWGDGLAGARRLSVLKGQVFAASALFGNDRQLQRILGRLEKELSRQILGDGGHHERSPAQQFAILRDLVDIRAALIDSGHLPPHGVQNAIDRMAPMLRFFRHGDGGLALFNDSDEGEAWLIDMVLSRADAPGKPHASAPHSGFERITANRTLIIADVGAPPPNGARDHVFAGTLSFEMSIGKERLIVNCGGGPGLGASWRQGLRATAAHSTLSIGETNSTEIFEAPGRGSEIGKHPESVTKRRSEDNGATWLEGRHDGYVRGFGLIHERKLWLAAGGEELRGEDILLPPGGQNPARIDARKNQNEKSGRLWPWRRGRPRSFHLRFHLHPGISASPMQDGASVLLRLPSGVGWQFHADGGNVSVESSVYVGDGETRRCNQIVVTGGVTATGPRPGAVIRWVLNRVGEQ